MEPFILFNAKIIFIFRIILEGKDNKICFAKLENITSSNQLVDLSLLTLIKILLNESFVSKNEDCFLKC
jgi:hypothetical protein